MERHQITLALGACTVGCAHADRWPLEVLAELLGQRLLAELRFRRGLTYTPWAYNIFQRDSGYFAAQVTVADRHEEWARDTLQGELDELTQAAPRRRAVRNAARLVWANWAAADENNYERAATLADPILDWPADQPPPDIEAELAAVTPADITRVVRTYFVPEGASWAATPPSSPWTTWWQASTTACVTPSGWRSWGWTPRRSTCSGSAWRGRGSRRQTWPLTLRSPRPAAR